MGIITILTFGFVGGILSSAIADRIDPSERRPVKRLPSHVPMLGYVNTTIEEIEEFDRKLCARNGGSTAYDDHKKEENQFSRCVDNVQREVINEFFTDVNYSLQSKVEDFYKGYCRKISKIENCLKSFTDSMKTCLDVSKHESAEIIYNTASSVMQFMCDHDGLRVDMFISSDGNDCLNSKRPNLTLCANHTLMKYITDTVPNGAEVGGLGRFHLLVPDTKKCTIFNKFEVCAIDQLKGCPDQTTADLATSIFKIVKEVTTCDRLAKSQASPVNIVDVLSMTALTAFMSMRFV